MKVQYVDNLYICAITNRPKLPKKIVSLHSGIIRHDPTMAQATWSLAFFFLNNCSSISYVLFCFWDISFRLINIESTMLKGIIKTSTVLKILS